MVPLASLWLPILLSAVIVFVASSILHMLLPYHRSDFRKLPDEDKVTAAIRASGAGRGMYMFPHCSHADMKSPAVIEKFKQGPVGILTLMAPGAPNLGKYLGQWFVFCLLANFFVAYLAAHTLNPGADYLVVFRVVGTAGFLVYGLGYLSNGIWKAEPWAVVIKHVIDGLIYGLLVAGTFGWRWPR